MALSKALEELLAQVKDEGDRKELQSRFEKYDFLQTRFEGNLRQEDYDRNLNKVKADRAKEQEELKVSKEYADKMKVWAEKNVPKHEELVKNYGELETKYKDLDEKYKITEVAAKAAEAAGGDGKTVDAAELAKRVDEVIATRGYVSQKEVQKIADEEARKLVAEEAGKLRDNFYKTDIPNFMGFITAMTNLQFRHRDEFKEALDPVAFSKFMVDEKIEDPIKAYDRFTVEKRSAADKVRIEAEIRDKVEKDFASKHNLPGSGAPPASELGPVQMARMNKTPHIPATAEAGDSHELAYAAAAELRQEGKF
jgi:hypothetical protein